MLAGPRSAAPLPSARCARHAPQLDHLLALISPARVRRVTGGQLTLVKNGFMKLNGSLWKHKVF